MDRLSQSDVLEQLVRAGRMWLELIPTSSLVVGWSLLRLRNAEFAAVVATHFVSTTK